MWAGQQDNNGFGSPGFGNPGFGGQALRSPGFGGPAMGSPGMVGSGFNFGTGTVERNRNELQRDVEERIRAHAPNQNYAPFSQPYFSPNGGQQNAPYGGGMGFGNMMPANGFGGVSGGYFMQ